MKTTSHFENRISERSEIRREWCERVVQNPIERREQPSGRVQCWGYIHEVKKYLRVVLLEDGETLHTAYFDRRFKETK